MTRRIPTPSRRRIGKWGGLRIGKHGAKFRAARFSAHGCGAALGDFEAAVSLAPLSERYVVEAANQADLLGDRRRAAQLFAHAVDIDPASADAIAGLGVVAWENGDRERRGPLLERARGLSIRAR